MFGLLIYYFLRSRNSQNQIALLLTANIYLALMFFSEMFLNHYARVLPAYLYSFISLNNGIYGQIRDYLHWVLLCPIFYSDLLQVIHRLCRVVFYAKSSYQSLKFYQILIVFQWIFCFLTLIPTLLLGDFRYSNVDYNCQIDGKNLRNAFINCFLTYEISVNFSYYYYVHAWIKMRRGNNSSTQMMTQIQTISSQRDLVVLFRTCCL